MPHAAALRLQIETALAPRIQGALTPRPRVVRDLAATGVPELDTLLDGGLPVGAITELVGPLSSGRTTLALAVTAEMTQAGKTVAWVDASDCLDPASAAAAGVDLSRQLWVRCGAASSQARTPWKSRPAGEQRTATAVQPDAGAALVAESSGPPAPSGGCGSPHPRGEARGLSQAVDAFLQRDVFSRPAPPRDPALPRKNRMTGTPSAPNRKVMDRTPQDARPLSRRSREREEQVPSDRQPSRRQQLYAQRTEWSNAKTLRASQILNTADLAAARGQAGEAAPPPPAAAKGGAWTDNRNNAHGRSLATAPNAIAAGLPRFREMEARAAGQGHGMPQTPFRWKPSRKDLQVQVEAEERSEMARACASAPPALAFPSAGKGAAERPVKASGQRTSSLAGEPPQNMGKRASPFWHALDQALRATDLLLAAGGFSALVLDLGSVPAEFAWRIPLATWFRFRTAADRARTVLLVLTQHPCARSSAELVLRFSSGDAEHAGTVLTGAQFHLHVDRRRFETQPTSPELPRDRTESIALPVESKLHLVSARKQPQRERATTWHRQTAWTGTGPRTGHGGVR